MEGLFGGMDIRGTAEIVIDADCPEESASQLLEELDQTNRIVKFYSEDGSVRAYRTDTAELVRFQHLTTIVTLKKNQ